MSTQELAAQSNAPDVKLPFNLTQLLAFAMQKPRNPDVSIAAALHQLQRSPEFAKAAYYSIPYKQDGKTVYVEGPTIKAATVLSGCWGNVIEGGYVGAETEDYVDVMGYMFDYETGKMTIRPLRVSKTYRTAKGETVPWRLDMLKNQIAAGISKAIRNAVLNGLPMAYVNAYFTQAKALAARGGRQPNPQAPAEDAQYVTQEMEQVLKAFEAMGVERPEVTGLLQRNPEHGTPDAQVAFLIGLLNAIQEGNTTVDQVFTIPDGEQPLAEPQPAPTEQRQTARPAPKTNTSAPRAAQAAKLPIPATGKEMDSRNDGNCNQPGCKVKIKTGEPIIYDYGIKRAYHRSHFA